MFPDPYLVVLVQADPDTVTVTLVPVTPGFSVPQGLTAQTSSAQYAVWDAFSGRPRTKWLGTTSVVYDPVGLQELSPFATAEQVLSRSF